MLTGNTSNTSRHSETRQSQAGRSPGLARHLFGLPQNIVPKIWSFIPSEKAALASDLFEKSSPEKKELDRDLQLWLLNRSILPEEREGFLLKALTQPNVDNAQSDFSYLLRPVFTERHPAPYLPRLLELAAYGNKSIAFERVIETALENHTPLPESTYEWVAECGKPEMLDTLLRETQPDLSEKRQKELEELAKAQEETIQKYNQLTLSERQDELEAAARLNTHENRKLSLLQRFRHWLFSIPPLNAHENRRPILALLQTPGIDVNARNQNGQTPLHWGAQNGRNETVKTLLKAPEIDVNAANFDRDTALHLAAQNGHTETVNALLEAPGNDVGAANLRGDTALHLAAQNGHAETMNALLGAPDININAANYAGDTPLHLAAFQGHAEIMNALLGAPEIDVNAADRLRYSPLHLAALNGRTETVNALLEAPGIDVGSANLRRDTSLHGAAQNGRTETVNALLEAPGININAANLLGKTPLHYAAQNGHTETVNALLGAPEINVNAAARDGYSPLQLAVRERHTEIANALRQAGGI